MAHLHITSWVIAFALVGLVTTFARSGNDKGAKISHMILRADYLLILYSGGSLFASYANYSGLLIFKVLVGLWTIAAMEMACVKYKKKKPAAIWWTQLVVAGAIAIILGFGFLGAGILPAK
ncbi:YisL family protein [Halobacillus halophilus]|uniref:YisL family protein n=1 Tax=Halobacillus halophilus TaxID=1570 RepID=UPI001CD6B88E|nr:YisL family protein [Halobacillus halophilus]MCA1011300.1 YisL family protein [Halobacillus halophilus]